MKSLQILRETAERAVFALMIISSMALAVAAQKVDVQQQGKMYGEPDLSANRLI